MTDVDARAGSKDPVDDAIRNRAEAWLLRLVSGQATTADAEAFRRWRDGAPAHARAFAQVQQLWDALDPAARMAMAEASPARMRQGRTAMDHKHRRRRAGRRAFLGTAVMASAAYVAATSPFGLWPDWEELGADYRTAAGEQTSFTLDGVLVELNTRSAVKRRIDGTVGSGLTVVGGEVALSADRSFRTPFSVLVSGVQVDLLGPAELNIRCDEGGARISCIHGHVDVRSVAESRRVLARQSVLVKAKSITSGSTFDPAVLTAWRRQLLVFDGVPLASVVHEVNRYWRGRIVLMDSALSSKVVHMRMSLQQLRRFPELVRDAYGVTVRTMPGGVVLIG